MTVLGIFYAVSLTDYTSPTPKQKHLFKRKLRRLLNLHLMHLLSLVSSREQQYAFCLFFSFLRVERSTVAHKGHIDFFVASY